MSHTHGKRVHSFIAHCFNLTEYKTDKSTVLAIARCVGTWMLHCGQHLTPVCGVLHCKLQNKDSFFKKNQPLRAARPWHAVISWVRAKLVGRVAGQVVTVETRLPSIHDHQLQHPAPLPNLISSLQITGDQGPLWPDHFCSTDVSRRPALSLGLCRSREWVFAHGLLSIHTDLCPQPGGSSVLT